MKIYSKYSAQFAVAGLFLAAGCLLPAVASRAAVVPAVTTKLPNGTTLVVRADQVAPRVALSLLVRAGAADETPANAGWRQILGAAMLRASLIDSSDGSGAKITVTLDDWQRQMEKWGGQLGATVGDDFIEFWANGDSAHAAEMLEILKQIVAAPRLAESDFINARRRALSYQNQASNGVASRAAQSLSKQLYRDAKGAPLAYALPTFGSFNSIGDLTGEQLRALHQQYFTPARYTLSAAGDVDAAVLRAGLEDLKATPAEGSSSVDVAPAFAPLAPKTPPLVVREMNTLGAWVFVAYRTPATVAMSSSEYAALKVLTAALDGASTSRLRNRLQRLDLSDAAAKNNKESAGQVAAQLTARRWANEMIVFAQTNPQNVDSVKNALLDEIAKLRNAPLSPAELQSAKNFARGSWATSHEAPAARAFEAGAAAMFGITPDSQWPVLLQAVTAANVQAVAKKYLQAYSVVLIMPQGGTL